MMHSEECDTYKAASYDISIFLIGDLRRYVEHGVPPGSFLTAVLCNDLIEATGRADYINKEKIVEIVTYCVNELPRMCWRSRENFNNWIEMKSAKKVDK